MLRLNLRKGDSAFRFAAEPEWMIPDDGAIPEAVALDHLTGRRVLVLIHGYNVADALDAYARIGLHVATWYDADDRSLRGRPTRHSSIPRNRRRRTCSDAETVKHQLEANHDPNQTRTD